MNVGIYNRYRHQLIQKKKRIWGDKGATHSLHADFLRNIGHFVNINLVEFGFFAEALGKLLEDRRDHATRATPCRPEIKDGVLVLFDLYEMPVSASERRRGRKVSMNVLEPHGTLGRTISLNLSSDGTAVTPMVELR